MIQDLDAHQTTGLHQTFGQSSVVVARFGVARRMIVHQDDARRRMSHGWLENLTRMHDSHGQRPHRDFLLGDDCIAGRYWDNTLISGCIVNSSCNGIRLIGPAKHLIIHDCLFYGPGIHPHRTSDRHNMLAGINLQPGAWDATKGRLDDVLISDISMHNVATPFHISLKPGNTAGSIVVDRVTATGVYRAAASVESWAEEPFENVTFRDVTISYKGGGKRQKAKEEVKSPGVDARSLPAWGFFARNVKELQFDNVRLRYEKEDLRPAMICNRINRLSLQDFSFPQPAEVEEPIVLSNVGSVQRGNMKKGTEE